ncbi:beta-galactosidase GalA [uncultured Sphingomonas sp.]|uniref:beta-galactosidase GalA n=1 Tax=uncultured Sphingomonas sp. TaxID=158754 RepID=UPI0025F14757|nr:beta-galactosidase GalA [uncultured Sphingomonas sp.]
MNRRSFLLSGAVIAALGDPVPLTVAMARGAGRAGWAGALPMPAPLSDLPIPLPVVDPGRVRLEQGWVFHAGDVPVPPPVGHHETYLSVKAGNAPGAAAAAFDDSDWTPIRLPHDWAAAQPFVQSANVSQGYRPRGIGWYRRVLTLDSADRGKRIELHFDGIASHATVWINGSEVAHSWSGYSSVVIDMTPFARFGEEENVVAIRVDAEAMEGWWYEGAGLYRHAWLVRRAPVAIATDGVHCDPRGHANGWQVPVAVTLDSVARDAATVTIQAQLLDGVGRVVAQDATDTIVSPLDQGRAALVLNPDRVELWSVERPMLYTVLVRVIRDGGTVDERRVPVGFRTIRFDADRGFLLNDRSVKLKGVCLHQDHAGVGVAVPDTLLEWRLLRLKAMGCNAIRCSHGAPAEELLHLADRMGFLVMNENRRFNPAPDYLAQLQWLVRRDRNHPSIILWSVFNEEPMQGSEAGVEMVRRMVHAVKTLDDSRPVTAAMNGAFLDPVSVSGAVDVTGFNYYQDDYDRFHRAYPNRPMTSSEDTSAYETRGAYDSDPVAHVITSYDTEVTSWGDTHRATWKKIAERPFVAGGFVWTGFDYHGEPTPYDWPTISSFFGILDLCGFPKTAFDIRSAQWIDDRPVARLSPHWTWPGREGQPIKVVVSCNAETVALSLNGEVLGTQAVDRIMGNEWSVLYAPGRIEAVARTGGRIVAVAAHETTGHPVALRLTPARTVMAGDGEDVQPITVDAVDARGRHVPTVNLPARFTVQGGAVIGLGNGDPNSHEPEQGNARSLFNGLAQVIVRAGQGGGRLVLTATAPGLRPARVTVDRARTAPVAQVAVTPRVQRLLDWRRSPAFATRPSPNIAPTDGDNNSWAFVQPGRATQADTGGSRWRVYRTAVTPWRRVAAKGGVIRFDAVAGRAELWVDGRKLADKASADPAPLFVALPPASGRRRIALLVEAAPGAPSGLLAPVTIAANPAE